MSETINLTEFSNIPPLQDDEQSRDHLIERLTTKFGGGSQTQILKGDEGSGKTTTLAQFARLHPDRTISYFITDNPQTQRIETFLYHVCNQLSILLGTTLPEPMSVETYKSLLAPSVHKLSQVARKKKIQFYFIIDGIDRDIEGTPGERIVDHLPITYELSPYLLISCRSNFISKLPTWIDCKCIESTWPFLRRETGSFLENSGFSTKEIEKIHTKHDGNPSILRSVKDMKARNPNVSLSEVLEKPEKIREQRISLILNQCDQITKDAIEFLSISPISLPVGLLAKVVSQTTYSLQIKLDKCGLFRSENETQSGKIEFLSNLDRQIIKKQIETGVKNRFETLIKHVKTYCPDDEFLLAVLASEAKDYNTLEQMLVPIHTVTTIREQQTGISSVLKRLQLALQIAKEQNNANGLLKWSLSIASVKGFLQHSLDESEIEALISIGRIQDALRKAYLIADIPTRIRLISKAYSHVQNRGEVVSTNEKDELKALVENLNIHDIELQVAQRLAVDLFNVLPNVALNLLEKLQISEEQKSILDIAALAMLESSTQSGDETIVSEWNNNRIAFDLYRSKWLTKATFLELQENLKKLETTKSKEQCIRHWCRRNGNDVDLYLAINLWLDTVVGDRNFVIPLLYLRQICELLFAVDPQVRSNLANRLRIPIITSLDSPLEEWVRVRLSLAEALSSDCRSEAEQEIQEVYIKISAESSGLEVKTYCLAKLLSTIHRYFPDLVEFLNKVQTHFQLTFNELRDNSADHYDHVRKTLQALVEFDPESALLVALELNLQKRRQRALLTVLRASLRKHGSKDITNIIDDVCDQVSRSSLDSALLNLTNELSIQEANLADINIDKLLFLATQITHPEVRALTFVNLAQLQKNSNPERSIKIVKDVIDVWKEIKDLRTKLLTGYSLVDSIAELDKAYAQSLFDEIQKLQSVDGTTLASGSLGPIYAELTRLALRSITANNFVDATVTLPRIEDLILRLPSPSTQIELFGKLASSLYRVDKKELGDEIVRTKVLAGINNIDVSFTAELISENLPVISEYDFSEAKSLSEKLPLDKRNSAWFDVMVWTLTHCFLGDQEGFISHEVTLTNTYPRLKKAFEATKQITSDLSLFSAIKTICNNIKRSFDSKIDILQATFLLEELDQLATRHLPDKNNIWHDGYLLLSHSATNNVRSFLWKSKAKNKGALTKELISNKWKEISNKAKDISNIADRVFVMAFAAVDMSDFYDKNERKLPKELLELATEQIAFIPTALDRMDRIGILAESLSKFSDNSTAKFILEQAVKSINQLGNGDTDRLLNSIVQVSYNVIGSDFATELMSRFDSSRDQLGVSMSKRSIQIEKLRKNPSLIDTLRGYRFEREDVIHNCAHKLLGDVCSGKGRGIEQPDIIFKWLSESQIHNPAITISICKWVVETGQRNSTSRNDLDIFIEICDLTARLADVFTAREQIGIPEAIETNFAGLSPQYFAFKPSETERAKTWLQNWLKNNANSFVKICDPYFEIEHLEYLKFVPFDCRVLIVTTNKNINPEHTAEKLAMYWYEHISAQTYPFIRIIVVPELYFNEDVQKNLIIQETKFHDRVVITNETGLDLGPSLNGLGKSFQKVGVLTAEDSKYLEQNYLKSLMDTNYWLFNYGVDPLIITLDPKRISLNT